MTIQWFPGHMAKTRKLISENLKMVDVVIELLDARIPLSSKNPEIDNLVKNKPKVIVLNKSDLADKKISDQWIELYNKEGYSVVLIDSIKGTGINVLRAKLHDIMKDKIENQKNKGIIYRPIRTMILGIPNVGKSSLINKIAGRAKAETGDKPGITRQKQWVRLGRGIEMLDMPGILWPKFDDKQIGLNLAITGAIKDEIFDTVEAASVLMSYLYSEYTDNLKERYKIEKDIFSSINNIDSINSIDNINSIYNIDNMSSIESSSIESIYSIDKLNNMNNLNKGLKLLEAAGRKRGCLISGGEVDMNRIAAIVLDEFRGGKIGKISLEKPE